MARASTKEYTQLRPSVKPETAFGAPQCPGRAPCRQTADGARGGASETASSPSPGATTHTEDRAPRAADAGGSAGPSPLRMPPHRPTVSGAGAHAPPVAPPEPPSYPPFSGLAPDLATLRPLAATSASRALVAAIGPARGCGDAHRQRVELRRVLVARRPRGACDQLSGCQGMAAAASGPAADEPGERLLVGMTRRVLGNRRPGVPTDRCEPWSARTLFKDGDVPAAPPELLARPGEPRRGAGRGRSSQSRAATRSGDWRRRELGPPDGRELG